MFVGGQTNFFPIGEESLTRGFNLLVPNQVQNVKIFEQRYRFSSHGEFRAVVTFSRRSDAISILSKRSRRQLLKRTVQMMLPQSAPPVYDDNETLKFIDRCPDVTDSQSFEDLAFLISLRIENWKIKIAPDMKDIIWDALTVDRLRLFLKSVFINSILVAVLFAFTTPVSFITFASGVASPYLKSEIASGYSNFVAKLRFLSPGLGDFLFGFLPQILLVFCDAYLLFALQIASKLVESHHTYSAREKSLFRKSFWFLIFNTLILPSLALSNLTSLVGDLFQNETSPFALLGKAFVTSSGAFTLTFVATQTWVGAAMNISRLSERLCFVAKGIQRMRFNTLSERTGNFSFDYGGEYAITLTMFALCIVFSTVVPPILFFGVIYFFIKQASDNYCLRHLTTPREIDGLFKAHVAKVSLKYSAVALILLQSTMFGFFSSEVCIPKTSRISPSDPGEFPCIASEYSGTLAIRGTFLQLLSLLICLVSTCVYVTYQIIREDSF